MSVSAGVEAHGGLAAQGAARAATAVGRMADAVAVELVTAVRALELGSRRVPAGGMTRSLLDAARERMPRDLHDRPLSRDVAAARAIVLGEAARGPVAADS